MDVEAYTSCGSVGLLDWTIRPAVDGDVASHSFKPVVVRPSGKSLHMPHEHRWHILMKRRVISRSSRLADALSAKAVLIEPF